VNTLAEYHAHVLPLLCTLSGLADKGKTSRLNGLGQMLASRE
jgi:hypothetical protein